MNIQVTHTTHTTILAHLHGYDYLYILPTICNKFHHISLHSLLGQQKEREYIVMQSRYSLWNGTLRDIAQTFIITPENSSSPFQFNCTDV